MTCKGIQVKSRTA